MQFQKAVKTQRKLRMALFGPSGSGKTYTALAFASALVPTGKRFAVVDTERSSASLYAEKFDFDVCALTRYTVDDYINTIRAAEQAGYGFLVIDSLSHAWEGPGGILERVEEIKLQRGYRDGMRAWADVKPEEARLWDAILDCECSVIATMRSKTAYEIDKDEKGKTHVEKLGLAPIQRADKEYEFDLVGRMEIDNTLVVTKSRCEALSNGVFRKPDGNVSAIIREWISSGAAETPVSKPVASDATTMAEARAAAASTAEDLALDKEWVRSYVAYSFGKQPKALTVSEWVQLSAHLRAVHSLSRVLHENHLEPADPLAFLGAHFATAPSAEAIAQLTNDLQLKESAHV